MQASRKRPQPPANIVPPRPPRKSRPHPSQTAPNPTIRTLQALRGAACLLVVIYHTLQASAGEAAIRAWPNGSAGVDLFFVISGYVMMASTRRLAGRPSAARVFLIHRAWRLVPLYWLLTLAKYAIATLWPAASPHTSASLWNLAASLCFIPARNLAGQIRPVLPVGWSLNFEVFFYALFALTLAARRPPWWLVPVLAATALAGAWRTAAWPAPLFLANGLVLEFALGMLAWQARRFRRPPAPLALLLFASVLLLVLPLAGQWRWLVWGAPATAMLLAALALEPRYGARLPRLLLALGEASFAIYLAHPFVIPLLARHAPVLAVPVSVVVGMALHRFVDAPMQAGKRFFFEKKNQKTFASVSTRCSNAYPNG
jgi:exopolysaccharide production protein ExoZ